MQNESSWSLVIDSVVIERFGEWNDMQLMTLKASVQWLHESFDDWNDVWLMAEASKQIDGTEFN